MSGTIHRLPVDPDLERAMVELLPTAIRLRELQAYLITHGADRAYEEYAHRRVLLGDARRAIAGRAVTLALKPGALLLFIEERERLRKRLGKRPTLAQLQRATLDAQDVRRRDLLTRASAKSEADYEAEQAAILVADAEDAVRYMEASCNG